MIRKRMFYRTGVLFAAAVVWAAFSTPAQEGAKSDLERLYGEFNEISLDTSKGFAVKNFLLEHDSFSAELEDGIIFFSNKIGGQFYAAVFLGKGETTLRIPEPVKDMQFRNILRRANKEAYQKGIKGQPFEEAFLVVPPDIKAPINYELLSGKFKVPGSEVTAVTEGGLLEKHRARAQELFAQQAGPPDWREIPVRAAVWRHLNNFTNEHFEFRANVKDFQWVRFRFNPDFERECRAGRIAYEAEDERQQVVEKGGVEWDLRKDYRQGQGGWTANLRERFHEDSRAIEIFHYDMDITVEKAALLLKNKMTMRIRPRKEEVRCARFDFLSHWQDDRRKAFIIKKCADAEGNPLPFLHDGDELLVDLGDPLEEGKEYAIALEYEAEFIRPLDRTFLNGSWEFLPAEPFAHLLPSTHPWHPWSVRGGGATYDVRIRVPSPFIAAASGATVKRWDDETGYAGLHTRLGEPARHFAVVFGSYKMLSGKLYDTGEDAGMEESEWGDSTGSFYGSEEDSGEEYEEYEEEDIDIGGYAEKWGDTTIYVYALERQRKRLPDMLDKVRNILHAYNEFFRVPIRFDELDIVQMSFFAGFGQAPPGLVQLTGEAFLRPAEFSNVEGGEPGFLDGFLAHELAHAWWPHITGMRNDEQDAWLSEAFAEYSSGLYLELFKEGEEAGTGFKALCEEAKADWLTYSFWGGGILDIKPYEQGSLYSPGVSYETQAYQKGPYVLHMLRNILGPELFQTLLQRFLKDFAGEQPVTPDFIDTVRKVIGEHVTGETFKTYMESKTPITEWSPAHRDEFLRLRDFYKNLDAWFEDWYVDPGHAKIRFSWSAQKGDGGYVFTGRIEQDPEEFKMVLAPIDIRFKKDSTFVRRFVDKPDYEFQLRFPREPTGVVFDEFKTLAAEVTVEAAQP